MYNHRKAREPWKPPPKKPAWKWGVDLAAVIIIGLLLWNIHDEVVAWFGFHWPRPGEEIPNIQVLGAWPIVSSLLGIALFLAICKNIYGQRNNVPLLEKLRWSMLALVLIDLFFSQKFGIEIVNIGGVELSPGFDHDVSLVISALVGTIVLPLVLLGWMCGWKFWLLSIETSALLSLETISGFMLSRDDICLLAGIAAIGAGLEGLKYADEKVPKSVDILVGIFYLLVIFCAGYILLDPWLRLL